MSGHHLLPQQMAFVAFASTATIVKLENHGRDWEVFLYGKSLGFADGTKEQALKQSHEREVNNALYSNTPANLNWIPVAEMPTAAVLEEYPHLRARFPEVVTPSVDAVACERDINARKSIEKNNDEMLVVPRNDLDALTAQLLVSEDIASLQDIRDLTERYFAAVAMGDSAENQASYKEELRLQDQAIANEVDAAFAENRRRINAKEERKRVEWASMEQAAVELPGALKSTVLRDLPVGVESEGLQLKGETTC